MSKSIIENYLLVSGKSSRHEILDLERRCEKAGFSLGRTGQFGIGVLSYFMIADRVVLTTRRSQDSGESESNGWTFETQGIGSFGELKRNTSLKQGTEIRLHLRSQILGKDSATWFKKLGRYLEEILIRIPCNFVMESKLSDFKVTHTPGWVRAADDLKQLFVTSIEPRDHDFRKIAVELLPQAKKEEIKAQEQHWHALRAEAFLCLNLITKEGKLPNGLGSYRIHLPFYELAGGKSLVFMRVAMINDELSVNPIGAGYAHALAGTRLTSWLGFNTTSRNSLGWQLHYNIGATQLGRIYRPSPVMIEIDLESSEAGKLAVSRNSLQFSQEALDSFVWLDHETELMLSTFLEESRDSAFAYLNQRLTNLNFSEGTSLQWLQSSSIPEEQSTIQWGPISFPAMSSINFRFSPLPYDVAYNASEVSVIRSLGDIEHGNHYDGLTWNSNTLSPDAIFVLPSYTLKIGAVWNKPPSKFHTSRSIGLSAKFPPKWRHLSSVKFDAYSSEGSSVVWNSDNFLLGLFEESSWAWCETVFGESLDPLPFKKELLKNTNRLVGWIIKCILSESHEIWDGLKDRDSNFLPEVWQLLFHEEQSKSKKNKFAIYQWVEEPSRSRLRVLDPDGWHAIRDDKLINEYLPDPGKKWTLTVDSNESRERQTWRELTAFVKHASVKDKIRTRKR